MKNLKQKTSRAEKKNNHIDRLAYGRLAESGNTKGNTHKLKTQRNTTERNLKD